MTGQADRTRQRATYLRVDEVRLLDHWCDSLGQTFGTTPYLVGSVLIRSDYRDVDVRVMLDDDAYEAIPMHVLDLNMLLSRWGQQSTGLPIDCQVQSYTEWQKQTASVNVAGRGRRFRVQIAGGEG